MVYKNLQSNKSLAKYKKTMLLTKFRTATVRHNLTSYHLMYGYPRPGIPIQHCRGVTPPSPTPPPSPRLLFSKERNPGNSVGFCS